MSSTWDRDREATGSDVEAGSDRRLWDSVQGDDACAFETLFQRHVEAVTCHCHRRLSHELTGDVTARCEDAVAETFLHAWRRRESVMVEETLLPWLLTTATHCCENIARAERRRGRLRVHLARQPEPWSADDEPADAAATTELVERMRIAIDRMPPIDADVAELCVLQGMTPGEAAALLEISEAALRGRLYRLRRRLRTELPPSGSA